MKRRFVALNVVVISVVAGCGDAAHQVEPTASPSTTTVIPVTSPSTTAPPTTAAASTTTSIVVASSIPATTTPPTVPVVPALPGRLPPVDATSEVKPLFPTPLAAAFGLELVPEVVGRLQTGFAAAGFFADVGFVSLVSSPITGGEEVALVFEVRNREESGDDTSPGYDLLVVMQSGQSGTWDVTGASRQTICKRGVAWNTDPPLCV